MSYDRALVDLAADWIAPLGTPTMLAMMGGATLYCDGVPYAIVVEDALWFKADAASDAAWDDAGAERFAFTRKDGTTATMNYRRAPDDIYDDEDAFREWADLALAAGRRAAARKRR